MSIINDCYNYIIGLTQSTCDCFDIPEEASTSLSGLYIDDLASLSWIKALENCSEGDLFKQMARARELAITNFQADTNAKLMQGFKLRRQNFTGSIGRNIIKGTLSQKIGDYYGIRIHCANIKSGFMVVKNIGAIFSETGAIALKVYNNLGDLITTLNIATEANKHKNNAVTDLVLPLHSPYVEHLEYYFIYQATSNQARNNDLKCNCGGFKPLFNTDKNYLTHTQLDRNFMWSNWVMAGGYHDEDIPDDYERLPHITNNLMYGLTLDVELKCKVSEVLCMDSLDFETNNLAGAMAIAIQNKAGAILGGWLVSSNQLSRLNITNTEQIIEDIKVWNSTYNKMVTFIATEADVSINDCLICRDIFGMVRTGIMV